jgi:8-oxo-dGTP pyrophosphatase MutT (NUDIX family)
MGRNGEREKKMHFKEILKSEILKELPGTEVQWALASSDRMVRNFPRVPRKDSVQAAVLIHLYPHNGKVHTVFIQRPEYDGVHGGQISFPGGKQEKGDKDLPHTAVREASEETGIDPENLEIIGILTPLYIPVSNIVVTPVVAWSDQRPDFRIQESEVRFVIEAEIPRFLDYSIVKTRPYEIRGEMTDIRYFDYDGHAIWGATAMIFHELLTIINRAALSPEV